MLSTEHLRYRKEGRSIIPLWVKDTPSWINHAQTLLNTFQSCVGQPLDQAQERWTDVEHQAGRSQKVVRGLRHLLEKKLSFEDLDASTIMLERQRALADRVTSLRSSQDCPSFPQQQVDLYPDLPSRRIITTVPTYTPLQLIRRYNLGLAQGLCLHATKMTLIHHKLSAQQARYLMRYLRFFGLLIAAHSDPSGRTALTIEGPLADFGGATKYRRQMASICGVLPWLENWTLNVSLVLDHQPLQLELNASQGLVSHYQSFMEYTPPEWTHFLDQLLAKLKDVWQVQACTWPAKPVQEWCCPDWTLINTKSGETCELFVYQAHQAQQLKRDRWDQRPPVKGTVLCIDRKLLNLGIPLPKEHVASFNQFPKVSNILKVLKSWD